MKALSNLLATALAFTLVASSSLAQEKPKMDSAAKKEVLERMTDLITKNAYVPGVDFNKVNTLLEEQKANIDKAESEDDFAIAVNTALQQ